MYPRSQPGLNVSLEVFAVALSRVEGWSKCLGFFTVCLAVCSLARALFASRGGRCSSRCVVCA